MNISETRCCPCCCFGDIVERTTSKHSALKYIHYFHSHPFYYFILITNEHCVRVFVLVICCPLVFQHSWISFHSIHVMATKHGIVLSQSPNQLIWKWMDSSLQCLTLFFFYVFVGTLCVCAWHRKHDVYIKWTLLSWAEKGDGKS